MLLYINLHTKVTAAGRGKTYTHNIKKKIPLVKKKKKKEEKEKRDRSIGEEEKN